MIEKAAPLVRASLFRRPADNATRVRKANTEKREYRVLPVKWRIKAT